MLDLCKAFDTDSLKITGSVIVDINLVKNSESLLHQAVKIPLRPSENWLRGTLSKQSLIIDESGPPLRKDA